MTHSDTHAMHRAFASLRRFMQRPETSSCALCSAPIAPEHGHLLELATRQLVCSCTACEILFSDNSSRSSRYRRVPQRREYWPYLQISDEQWESFRMPIELAFFVPQGNSANVRVFYPSPAGAIESLLPLDAWRAMTEQNPALLQLEPEVESLLVNRLGAARDYFRLPIDDCYRFVGLIRLHWRGLSGGNEVWDEIDRFLGSLKAQASRSSAGRASREPESASDVERVEAAGRPDRAFEQRAGGA